MLALTVPGGVGSKAFGNDSFVLSSVRGFLRGETACMRAVGAERFCNLVTETWLEPEEVDCCDLDEHIFQIID